MRTINRLHDLPGMGFAEVLDPGQTEVRAAEAVPAYFRAYEERFHLPVYRPVTARLVCDRGERLRVETDRETFSARGIINATGTWDAPQIPYYPGRELFEGRQMHTRDYRTADEFAGQRVAIVGAGISALQMLDEISRVATTLWVTRRPPQFHEGAFTPEDAQQIAAAVFEESSNKINELSAIARDDTTRLTKEELDKARGELTKTRQAMTAFRMKSQIVDPEADLAGQMGVLSGLQAQLAEALVAHDLLLDNARPTDHRVTQSQQKIDALRRLIDTERGKFGAEGQGPAGESYAQLMAEYEKLAVDREFAEGAYRGARIAYEAALAEAQRKSRYLAAHIEPKVAQSSTEPDRPWLLFMVMGMLLAGWSILILVYYSIRDRQ